MESFARMVFAVLITLVLLFLFSNMGEIVMPRAIPLSDPATP